MIEPSIFEQYFNEYLVYHPSFASFLGYREADNRVEISISPTYQRIWHRVMMKYGEMLKKSKVIDLDNLLMQYALNDHQEEYKYPLELMPITTIENHILDFTFMENTIYPEPNTSTQLDNLIERHKCYIQYIFQAIENMREGIKKGYVVPKRICRQIIKDLVYFIKSKEYIINHTKNLDTVEVDVLSSFYANEYAPALHRLLDFIKKDYYPACRESLGFSSLPNGNNMYKYFLHRHTSLDISATEIHQLGLNEVKRIKLEFKKLIPLIYPRQCMSVSDFIKRVQVDYANTVSDRDEIVHKYQRKQKEIHKNLIPQMFYDQVTPYEVHPVPKILEASSARAFYYPGDKNRRGIFYINTRSKEDHPEFNVESLTLHEGEPGHHYQFQYMLDKNIPEYRIYGSDVTAYTEGWALYAESLSQSTDPLTNFGRLTYEMFRAVRCVVDTGIHVYGWSFRKAHSYIKRYVALSSDEITTEINRYICLPGQATAYKVGEQFFLKHLVLFLQKNPSKNIKDYHQLVLKNGVVPLNILHEIIMNDIKT